MPESLSPLLDRLEPKLRRVLNRLDQTTARVNELEQQLAQRDARIHELEAQVQQLSEYGADAVLAQKLAEDASDREALKAQLDDILRQIDESLELLSD